MNPVDVVDYLQGLTFRSNPNLRPKGAQITYTEDMISEYIKCKADPVYFISNYVKVVHPDRGIVLMELYDYQKRMVRAYHENRRVIFLTARQQGKTTVSAAYFVWYVLFNDQKSVAIMANKQATAYEIMDRFRLAYENLPKWMQQGVDVWNRGSVTLENGSKVFGSATTASGTRGKTVNILYLDEFAFVENNLAEAFFTAVYPTITAGKDTKVLMTSTPNGFNHFYKFWNEAVKGVNGFHHLRVHWYETPGRDQKWYDEQKAVLGELKSAQELDAEFLGSSLQLLTSATMARLTYSTPIKEYTDEYKGLSVYEGPVENRAYIMTVDVSRGRHLDSSAFIIFDVTQPPFRIVATYNNNEVAPMMYGGICHKMASNYNNAFILVEINDVGAQVADNLYYEFEYENLFWTKGGEELGKKGTDPFPGIRTTKKTKRIGCANLKDVVEKQQLLINDFKLITELSTFVQSKAGSYEADEGFHDDMVMCAVMFAWLLTQSWFKDLTDVDIRNKMYAQKLIEMDDELTPFGFMPDYYETVDEAL
jgi:hypothetical protein